MNEDDYLKERQAYYHKVYKHLFEKTKETKGNAK